ncbi:DUF1990 family protein [Streptomyces sp. HNM0575]|uniref:DUF1990 family protein n=1 Tax=Streptomyces sp. HNM0575 TaxID=2716338 RepID=UPI00145E34C6|nr:DUF1990 family protein [Streptomyces sp. HNM0575]NLU74233.1 DUF1990 family protein [Streptomyces sp. HNM0575]
MRRLGALARFPLGVLVVSWQYLWRVTALHRGEAPGDAGDLPPGLPAELRDERSKPLADGTGPMFHRRFTVRIEGSSMTPAELIGAVTSNLNRIAPSTVAVFHKTRGGDGPPCVGDEYRVQMPGPWDGPVRVVHSDPVSFRFGTLQGHLEAGQIEFRAGEAADGGLEFTIEAWSRAGDRLADLLYGRLRVAKEMQFNMWVHFCLRAAAVSGGRSAGGVHIDTRSIPEELCRRAAAV